MWSFGGGRGSGDEWICGSGGGVVVEVVNGLMVSCVEFSSGRMDEVGEGWCFGWISGLIVQTEAE